MFSVNPYAFIFTVAGGFVIIRVILALLKTRWREIGDWFHLWQSYKVPQFNDNFQENPLFRMISSYLSSLASIEDSNFANLFSGKKTNEIFLQLDSDQIVRDSFLGAEISWIKQEKAFVLRIRRKDKRRILRPYLQHIHSISDEIEQRKKEIKIFINAESNSGNGRWRSVPFTHPSTLETIAMDSDLKNKIKSDMESFLKSKQYYHRLGRVWKRSYLLYGPSGTGKTSFAAAMAKFLCYDIYDVNLTKVADDSDLKSLLLQTNSRSMIVIEGLDRFLGDEKSPLNVSLSGILNFMDGIFSCCGEERVMVFTMNSKDNIDPDILRPGRLDVHINFSLCDFSLFKTLATSYLGVKDHKLFPQIEDVFQSGASLSPAEVSEILIANRSSPSRALKSVVTALQSDGGRRVSVKIGGLSKSASAHENGSGNGRSDGESAGVVCTESVHTVREFRKLYGLLRMKSGRKAPSDYDLTAMEKDT